MVGVRQDGKVLYSHTLSSSSSVEAPKIDSRLLLQEKKKEKRQAASITMARML